MGLQSSDQLVGLTLHLLPKNQLRNVVIEDTGARGDLERTLEDRETCSLAFFLALEKTWQKTNIGSLNLRHGCWERNESIAYSQPSIMAIFYRGSVNFSAKLLCQ
ncbi:uncharacterized protein [Palaemon carinicauda]|uniref:uncharacterized protein n=1 Tax=Palaemon carinicauda TaxID=392227 RepID=UPI0035B5B7DF